MKFIKATIHAQ